jgi:hypothetical protein
MPHGEGRQDRGGGADLARRLGSWRGSSLLLALARSASAAVTVTTTSTPFTATVFSQNGQEGVQVAAHMQGKVKTGFSSSPGKSSYAYLWPSSGGTFQHLLVAGVLESAFPAGPTLPPTPCLHVSEPGPGTAVLLNSELWFTTDHELISSVVQVLPASPGNCLPLAQICQ